MFVLREAPVVREGLKAALDTATGGKKDARTFLRADKTVPYGESMQAMNVLCAAGRLKDALLGLEQ